METYYDEIARMRDVILLEATNAIYTMTTGVDMDITAGLALHLVTPHHLFLKLAEFLKAENAHPLVLPVSESISGIREYLINNIDDEMWFWYDALSAIRARTPSVWWVIVERKETESGGKDE